MAEDRRCDVSGCRGWRIRGSDKCAGHDPEAQERARAAAREKAEGLGLSTLRSLEDAKAWINTAGLALARGKLKPEIAREIRLHAQAWAQVHQGHVVVEEFERLKARVAELEGQRGESWRG